MQQQQYIKPGSDQHRQLITASKIPAIIGVDNFTTPQKLWLQMTGQIQPEPTNDAMMRGHIQEDSILEWFFQMERPDITKVAGETTWINPAHTWCAANTDAHGTDDQGRMWFVEAKSVARHNRAWGKPGTDQVPEKVWAQVQFQRWVADHFDGPDVYGTAVIKHGPYVDQYDTYYVDYDPQAAQQLADTAHQFWLSIQDPNGTPPEPVAQRDEHKWAAKIHPDIEQDAHWEISAELASAYIAARQGTKNSQALEDKAKADILRAMGNARTAEHNGLTIAYRRPTKTGVSLYPPQREITLDDLNHTATNAA